MGKRVNPRNKIAQKSIGFNFRQHMFFNKYTDFTPDAYCRKIVDDQIALIDPSFLDEEDSRFKGVAQ